MFWCGPGLVSRLAGCSPVADAFAGRQWKGIMVCEDRCRGQLDLVRSWLAPDHQECARWLLDGYMTGFDGRRFDELANGTSPPDVITCGDLDAVRQLSIRFPGAFVRDLERDDVKERLGTLLVQIPGDAVLEDLSCEQFEKLLGRDSAAWAAWHELSDLLKAARARAPHVGASKLLAAKRIWRTAMSAGC